MDWIKNKSASSLSWLGKQVDKVRNFSVSSIPFEFHIPGYQFCGPGTDYEGRIKKGQTGINSLDSACMKHDDVYNRTGVKTAENKLMRQQADDELIRQAKIFRQNSSSFGDKASGLATEGAIRLKKVFGIY